MLAVIQHQQQFRRAQPVDQRLQHRHITGLPHPQRRHHLHRHQCWIGDTGQLGQPHPVREPAGHPRPCLQGQPGLARPAGPGQGHQPRLPQQLVNPVQVLLAAHEAGQRRGQVIPRGRRRGGDLLAQDRLLQPAQVLPRLQPQLRGQQFTGPPVGRQRVGLAFGPVQRQHQQPPQPLPHRVLRDQALQLPGHLRVQAQLDVGLDAAFCRRQAELLQPRGLPRQRLHLTHISQRPPPPQPQGLPEMPRRGGRLAAAEHRMPRGDQPLEPARIHHLRVDAEHIAAPARRQRRVRGQLRPQPRDIRPQCLRRTRRRAAPPQLLHQPPGGHHPAGLQHQQRQYRPRPRAAHTDLAARPENLHRPQQPHLKR